MTGEKRNIVSIGTRPEIGLPKDWAKRLRYYHFLEIGYNVVNLYRLSIEQTLPIEGPVKTNIVLRNVAGEFLFREPITVATIQNHDELYRCVQHCVRFYDGQKYFVASDNAINLNRILELPIKNHEVLTRLFSDGANLAEEINKLFLEEYDEYFRHMEDY
ncbi:hypothetical protein [Fructobacillus evanidus]|uniref:Uncharacterized protein n=1 Tax=Fructobacillus evanidus TaxID=3064281 RepID=A0ABM9MWZ2_9LACO|nr:unnamed protein product [Fructobacillus sp. LMG 32999]CAK1229859.1 unnamed protein product [Fructobacillus sp. LMG 32999]CAK1230779.1 unnamed protein product [Fructobacillus sp. LMG 32999]CAK1230848.1 unnamed protein product [Fructobacillus sp. LMG 32999]CAK1231983.1 unnamed protein product [Fructobacillus sp. LMG 32999]